MDPITALLPLLTPHVGTAISVIGSLFLLGWRAYHNIQAMLKDQSRDMSKTLDEKFTLFRSEIYRDMEVRFNRHEHTSSERNIEMQHRVSRLEIDMKELHNDLYVLNKDMIDRTTDTE
jgi:hypothetical protein